MKITYPTKEKFSDMKSRRVKYIYRCADEDVFEQVDDMNAVGFNVVGVTSLLAEQIRS